MYFSLTEDSTKVLGFRCSSRDGLVQFSKPYNNKQLNFWLSRCEAKRGYIAWSDGSCQQLYVRGPCAAGQWVVPDHAKGRRRGRGSSWRLGKCECLPSFTATVDMTGHVTCLPPTVTLAHYLNTQAGATWQDWYDQNTHGLLRLFPSLGEDNMTNLVESKTWNLGSLHHRS